MSLYYSDEAVTIYHGDSREILPTLPTADLLVADPPFDLWADMGAAVAGHSAGTVVAFTSFQHRPAVESALGAPRVELVWTYRDGRWVSHSFPRLCHTSILVYGDIGDAYVGGEIHDQRRRGPARSIRRRRGPSSHRIPCALAAGLIDPPSDVLLAVFTVIDRLNDELAQGRCDDRRNGGVLGARLVDCGPPQVVGDA